MATWYRHDERGVIVGWWSTCYVVGGFAGTIIATYAATNNAWLAELGWRRGFFLPALLLAIIAVVYIVYTRNKPSDAGFDDLPEDDAEEAGDQNAEFKPSVLREVLANDAVWVTGGMYFFTKMTRYAFLFWLPLYMTEALGYSDSDAGYTSSVYELIGFLGVLIAGYASDKLFQARRFPVGSLMLLGLALILLLHPTLSQYGMLVNAISIGIIGIMTYGPDALMSGAAAMDIGSQRGAATAAGVINGMGSIGQLLSPLLVAHVAESMGWNRLFYIFVVFSLISAGLLATKWNYGGRGA
jgi:OPA family glycerol-3-phosphate transporter-like MFS transporter